MSDHPCEAQRTMERVFIPGDHLFDCLPFLSRAKVGFEFAMVFKRFDGLADAHLESKKRPWTLGDLMIRREQGDSVIVKDYCWTENDEHLPLPEELLPDNVIGFKCIDIRYVDHKVIDFLHRIRRLFQPKNNGDNNDGIVLELDIYSPNVRGWDIFCDSIWPLINPSAITKLYFSWNNSFNNFRQRISPTFLLDLANVRVLVTPFYVSFGNEENGQLVCRWLHTPREDGKPKLMRNYGLNLQTVEQVKTEFLSAQSAVSFIIAFFVGDGDSDLFVPFELDNWRTNERLAFRKVISFWLMERGPIGGRDAAQWAEWEREAMELELEQHNLLAIQLDDNEIGFLDEVAGPSGQQLQQQK